jgi:hypothetical protein
MEVSLAQTQLRASPHRSGDVRRLKLILGSSAYTSQLLVVHNDFICTSDCHDRIPDLASRFFVHMFYLAICIIAVKTAHSTNPTRSSTLVSVMIKHLICPLLQKVCQRM